MNSVFARLVYTGKKIKENVFVNFSGSEIDSLSSTPKGEVCGEFETVTPAFIDPHCHIGMFRHGEPPNESDVNDHLDSILPLLNALDGVQMDDDIFRESIENGILYSCVLPGSGNIIGGMSAVIRNYALDTNGAFIRNAGLKAAFGYNTMSPYSREKKGKRASTRMGCAAILRSAFYAVLKEKKTDKLTPDQKILKDVLDRKLRLRVHVHKSDDIALLLRIVDEFNLDITVEHACDVYRIETFRELAARKIPVVAGPIEGLGPKVELKHKKLENIKLLLDSGVKFGVMTDHDVNPQSNLFYVMRHFLRYGASKEEVISIITSENADIAGVSDILGTLSKGKWASFICWNGDPFDLASYPEKVYAEGREVFPYNK